MHIYTIPNNTESQKHIVFLHGNLSSSNVNARLSINGWYTSLAIIEEKSSLSRGAHLNSN